MYSKKLLQIRNLRNLDKHRQIFTLHCNFALLFFKFLQNLRFCTLVETFSNVTKHKSSFRQSIGKIFANFLVNSYKSKFSKAELKTFGQLFAKFLIKRVHMKEYRKAALRLVSFRSGREGLRIRGWESGVWARGPVSPPCPRSTTIDEKKAIRGDGTLQWQLSLFAL